MYHVLSTQDFSRPLIERLIAHAEDLRLEPRVHLRKRLLGTVVATVFYEPSTRTRLSFEAAMTKLGGRVIGAENALESSSAKKGESLRDVFRVVGSYVDAIIIRHHEVDAIAAASVVSPVPIINAGAGTGEHPTQSLVDVYTLWREFGRVDGLNVCVMGDLKYGRTVHSLLRTLTLFEGVQVSLVNPPSLGLPADLQAEVEHNGLRIRQDVPFEEALATADVIYQTRIQRERIAGLDEANTADAYIIRPEHLATMQPQARILHPLPRVDEIHEGVDDDERAAYFRQAGNGLYIRMALLDDMLGGLLK